jgi:hypothetical protein
MSHSAFFFSADQATLNGGVYQSSITRRPDMIEVDLNTIAARNLTSIFSIQAYKQSIVEARPDIFYAEVGPSSNKQSTY